VLQGRARRWSCVLLLWRSVRLSFNAMIREQIEGIERSPLIIRKGRLYLQEGLWLVLLSFVGYVAVVSIQVAALVWAGALRDWGGRDLGAATFATLGMVILALGGVLLAWDLAGREVISIEGGGLVVRREVLGIGRSTRLEAVQIKDIKMRPWDRREMRESAWGVGVGKVRLTIDGKECALGIALTDSEAESLAERLCRWRAAAVDGAAMGEVHA